MASREKLSHAGRIMRLRSLFEQRPFLTIRELEQEFGVCRKTVYNDLRALQEAGVPIYSELVDDEAHWMLQQEAKRKATITLTLHQGQVVPFGLAQRALSFLAGTDLYAQLGIIQERLAEGATPLTKKRLEEARRKIAIVPHGPKDYRQRADILDHILTGLLYDERVKITYLAVGASKAKAHTIEPLTMVLYREALYLIANSLTRRARLCFAVDRITRGQRLKGDRFDYPADYDPRQMFDGSFGLLGGETARVEVIFNRDQARYVRERRWHPTQRFEELPDGRTRMTMEVSGIQDVLLWLLGHTGTFEVIEPPALRQAVLERLRAGASLHGARRERLRQPALED